MEPKHIVIVGGGFAGVWAAFGAASLRKAQKAGESVAITLVSPGKDFIIRPRLYEADLSGTRVPLSDVLGPLGIEHRDATVETIHADSRELTLVGAEPDDGFHYDELVLCAGSRIKMPEVSAELHCVDDHQQATALHEAIAALGEQPDARFTATVLGAGFTGLEVATELADMLRAAAVQAGAQPPEVPVHLVDQAAVVGPEFGPKARVAIEEALNSLGIETHTGVPMSDVDEDGTLLANGQRIDTDLTVWAAGPRASALNLQLGLPLDPLGRVKIDPQMKTPVEGIWAAGDTAQVSCDGDNLAMMSCQHAIPQGRQAGENAVAAALGRPLGTYEQPLYLTCLDLGSAGALLTCGWERDEILATGEDGKRFKRFINRSAIYPPKSTDDAPLLKLGRTKPPGRFAASIQRLTLRSGKMRDLVTNRAEDHAEQFACTAASPDKLRHVAGPGV